MLDVGCWMFPFVGSGGPRRAKSLSGNSLPLSRGAGQGEGSVLPLRFMLSIRAESSVEPIPEWAKPVSVIVTTIIPLTSLARRKRPLPTCPEILPAPIDWHLRSISGIQAEYERNTGGTRAGIPRAPGLQHASSSACPMALGIDSSSHFGWSGRFGVHPLGCPMPHGIIRHSSHSSHSSQNENC